MLDGRLRTGIIPKKPSRKRAVAVYIPFAWQIAPLNDLSPTVLLTGSAGGGKSRCAAEKVHAACKKYPGAMWLAVRKTRESMTNSTVLFLERGVIGKDPQVKHVAQKHRFEYSNGSILAYGGMKDDEQREQIRSIGADGGVDGVWMEEANQFTEDDYNELSGRIRGKAMGWQQMLLSTNPDSPSHFINRRLIQGGEARVYYSRAADNPANPDGYIDRLAKLTGVLGKRLRDGLWVQAEGAIYDIWDAEIHLKDWFEIPSDWRRFRVIDFGFVNPFVCQWWAVDPDGRMYLYREIYMTHRTVAEHAVQINRYSEGETIEQTVCDHDAEDRATLVQHGIDNSAATKDVARGIDAVTERLKMQDDGKPRLFMLRGALVETDARLADVKRPTSTLEEIDGYVWMKVAEGKPVKDEPLKVNDHGMDAMRYGVMYVDGGGRWWLN